MKTTLIYIAAIAAAIVIAKVITSGLRHRKPCAFNAFADDPSLLAGLSQVRSFVAHIRTCKRCDKGLQRTLRRDRHYSRDMYPIWKGHLTSERAKAIKGFMVRVQSPVTVEEFHASLCRRCGHKVVKS